VRLECSGTHGKCQMYCLCCPLRSSGRGYKARYTRVFVVARRLRTVRQRKAKEWRYRGGKRYPKDNRRTDSAWPGRSSLKRSPLDTPLRSVWLQGTVLQRERRD
jgi:hypothetical protein